MLPLSQTVSQHRKHCIPASGTGKVLFSQYDGHTLADIQRLQEDEEEGEVKGKAADSTTDLLNGTAGAPESPLGHNMIQKRR